MIEVATHLRWGSYCCLRGGQPQSRPLCHRRGWALSGLLVVDAMIGSADLRANPYAFRLVYEARKLIETGLNSKKPAYVLAARDELRRAVALLESDQERLETGL